MIARYKWHFLVCVIFLLAVLYCVKTAKTAPFNSSNNPAKETSASPNNFYADNGQEKIDDLLTLRIRREIALDGEKAIYDIFDRQGANLGSAIFPYKILSNGDVIFGTETFCLYYSKKGGTLIPLDQVLDGYIVYTYDYLAAKKQIAFSGTKGEHEPDYIIIKDMNTGQSKIIDSSKEREGTEPSGCACSWAPDGKLYYNVNINNKLAIKVYDPSTDQASLYMSNTALSSVSPDGKYLSYVPITGQNAALIGLESGKVAQLAGYFICWDNTGKYVVTGHDDTGALHAYDLYSIKKVKEIAIKDGLLGDVSCEQGVLKLTFLRMQGEQISSVEHAQYQI